MNKIAYQIALLVALMGVGACIAETIVPPDRLALPLPKKLISTPTAAGMLICAPNLCKTTHRGSLAGHVQEGPSRSIHKIRLKRGLPYETLNCDEGLSRDPACDIGDRTISGEEFYVLGDGCLYVSQVANAYFPLTKKYCHGPKGKITRVRQMLYGVTATAVATQSIPLLPTPDSTKAPNLVAPGEAYSVVAAAVDEDDDFIGRAGWYLLRNAKGDTGWAPASLVAQERCEDMDSNPICYLGD